MGSDCRICQKVENWRLTSGKMFQSVTSNIITGNSVKGRRFSLFVHYHSDNTYTHKKSQGSKGGASRAAWECILLSSSHHRQSPSSSARCAVKFNTRSWRFSRPIGAHTYTHSLQQGVVHQGCNNKRDPRLWQPSAPPRGALVFMSAWVRIGECAVRSECVRDGCSQHLPWSDAEQCVY